MELTPLQLHNIESFEKEIAAFKKQIGNKNILFYIQLSWCITVVEYIFSYFFDALIEHKSLAQYVTAHGWIRIITSFIYWFVISYFLFHLGNKKYMKYRINEYKKYRDKLGLEQIAE